MCGYECGGSTALSLLAMPWRPGGTVEWQPVGSIQIDKGSGEERWHVVGSTGGSSGCSAVEGHQHTGTVHSYSSTYIPRRRLCPYHPSLGLLPGLAAPKAGGVSALARTPRLPAYWCASAPKQGTTIRNAMKSDGEIVETHREKERHGKAGKHFPCTTFSRRGCTWPSIISIFDSALSEDCVRFLRTLGTT